jgi:hypothetical protein
VTRAPAETCSSGLMIRKTSIRDENQPKTRANAGKLTVNRREE